MLPLRQQALLTLVDRCTPMVEEKIYEGTAWITIRKLNWGALQPYLW